MQVKPPGRALCLMDGNSIHPSRKSAMRTPRLLAAAAAIAALSGAAAADSVTYDNTIGKLFAERCANCHSSAKGAPTMEQFNKDKAAYTKNFKGPKMDDYESVMIMVNGTDAGAMMRRLDDGKSTKDGKPGNMYNYLGKNAGERAERLQKVKAWVGQWSLKRRNELTEAELKQIRAAEK
jgi:mono/diheme cytochrome c family protein